MTIRRPLRTALAAAALPLLVAGLAACSSGGDGVEQSQDSVQKQARTWDTTLAGCMRDAGYDFDDPGSQGTTIDAGQDEGWFTQLDACLQSTNDELGERPVTEAEKKAGEEASKEFAKVQECLEEHGVEFPEPNGAGLAEAPDVPADVAAACGSDQYGAPAGSQG